MMPLPLETLLAITVALPFLQTIAVLVASRPAGLRDVVYVGFAGAHAACVIQIALAAGAGQSAQVAVAEPLPGALIAFATAPMGVTFASTVSCLSFVAAIYQVGHARNFGQPHATALFALTAFALGAGGALAFAADLFTFFVSYLFLILAVAPIVALGGDENATQAGRLFLAIGLIAAMTCLLPAIVWVSAIAGDIAFSETPLLAGVTEPVAWNVLLFLFIAGLAASAPPLLHQWAPAASGAPAPILALLCAVLVMVAGGFGVLQVCVHVFGAEGLLQARGARLTLLGAGLIMLCGAALLALAEKDLQRRLTFSSVSQMGLFLSACMMAGPAGFTAAALQLIAHSVAKTALIFSGGVIAAISGTTRIDSMTGLGRRAPWAVAAFALGALSLIGAPPLAGAWAKFWAIAAARAATKNEGAVLAGGAIALGMVLTFAYLAPFVMRTAFAEPPKDAPLRPDGHSLLMTGTTVILAAALIGLVFLIDPLAAFLASAWITPS
jgi:multicomponent Na+:H+ antiporter subunit D